MRTTRRIRNLAFLGLLMTLVWAGPVSLRADSGGFYCGYGDCVLTYDECDGTWEYIGYPDDPELYPGECFIFLTGETNPACEENIDTYIRSGNLYYWSPYGGWGACQGSDACYACYQEGIEG